MKIFTPVSMSLVVLLGILAISFSAKDNRSVMPEICDNGIDDDMDGLIDLNDPDCICELLIPQSLIPNPSFEDMNCCPTNRSQLDCAQSWIQASEATTDFIHDCGWPGWDNFLPPKPFPDGEGIMGFRDGRIRVSTGNEPGWKEYAGACLLASLKAGIEYRFEFYLGFASAQKSPPIDITFFGTTNCDNLPFGIGNDFFGCPTNDSNWIQLGSSFVSGGVGNQWIESAIEITPKEDIKAIAIGPSCRPSSNSVSTYYFFDNLVLADLRSFDVNIRGVGHPCNVDFTMQIKDDPDFEYQWYKDGVAIIGETQSQLSEHYGEGVYQVRIIEDGSCRISEKFEYSVPIIYTTDDVVLCYGESYALGNQEYVESGSYLEILKSVNDCDSVISLDLEILGAVEDTVRVKTFEGELYRVGSSVFGREGDYTVELTSQMGCDSIVQLELEYFDVYVPNIFSPNNDGINDLFEVLGGENLLEIRELTIFDRWGTTIFSGPVWDGTYNDEPVGNGVYVYRSRLMLADGTEREISGSVTLVR